LKIQEKLKEKKDNFFHSLLKRKRGEIVKCIQCVREIIISSPTHTLQHKTTNPQKQTNHSKIFPKSQINPFSKSHI